MKKHTAYTAIIMTAIAILFAVNANAQYYPVTSVNDFQLRLICQHTVEQIGENSFLGTFVAGNSYNLPADVSGQSGVNNELEFKLTGQYGENYTVTSDVTASVGTSYNATINFQWYINEGSGYTAQSANTELYWKDDLENGTPGTCLATCYFKVAATSITTSSNTPHGTTFEFPVEVFATVNL